MTTWSRAAIAALLVLVALPTAHSQTPLPPNISRYVDRGLIESIDIAAAQPKIVLGAHIHDDPALNLDGLLQHIVRYVAAVRPDASLATIVDSSGTVVQSISLAHSASTSAP